MSTFKNAATVIAERETLTKSFQQQHAYVVAQMDSGRYGVGGDWLKFKARELVRTAVKLRGIPQPQFTNNIFASVNNRGVAERIAEQARANAAKSKSQLLMVVGKAKQGKVSQKAEAKWHRQTVEQETLAQSLARSLAKF